MFDEMSVDVPVVEPAAEDGSLVDPCFMVNGEPEHVMGLLDTAAGHGGRLAAAVYRASADVHRDAGAAVRRHVLALDAARHGQRKLAARITAVEVENEPAARWHVAWVAGSRLEPLVRHALTGHTHTVCAVAGVMLDGRPHAVTGSDDCTARVWDLTAGQQAAELTGHHDTVRATATAVVDGRPYAVTGSDDRTVRAWDLTSGERVHELTGHGGAVCAVVTAVVDGRPIAVTSSTDETVRIWDLTTSRQVDELTGHNADVRSDYDDDVWVVRTAVVDGHPVVVGRSPGALRMWDLATGQPFGEPFTGHQDAVQSVVTVAGDGRPVVAGRFSDGVVRLWDLATGQPFGEPFTGHQDAVHAVVTTVVDGRPVAFTSSADRTVRMWDLATGRQLGRELLFPSEIREVVVAPGGWLTVLYGWELAVLAHR
ncbi:WD40 repeat domain-containing protein [Streptomyces sp. PSKA54]|uniref:WD40 repeat domain-containing protein n=1 Tax=Streptomyces himalayensis subsp. aureolus TaxID=2758039 RepID=A0A7W2HKG0_9ACTN|nr:WD40 repeat domain-containing protein [Streptomyces himalayensis]MBA4867137.1 WD40 repeat domain-containing protein [Streptomyces himalayensis subsp. aureolus]